MKLASTAGSKIRRFHVLAVHKVGIRTRLVEMVALNARQDSMRRTKIALCVNYVKAASTAGSKIHRFHVSAVHEVGTRTRLVEMGALNARLDSLRGTKIARHVNYVTLGNIRRKNKHLIVYPAT